MEITSVVFFSYLSGSIPFGLILTKFFGGQDVRKIGSVILEQQMFLELVKNI